MVCLLWFLSDARLCILVLCIFVECFVTVSSTAYPAGDRSYNVALPTNSSLCNMTECNCTLNPTRNWHIVNCTFGNNKEVEFHAGVLPPNLMELSVIGGQKLVFHSKIFDGHMRNLCRIGLDGANQIVFMKHALYNITVTSLLVQINTCEKLTFHTNSFDTNEGPVTMEVNQCGHVQVQRNVWNFLDTATFENISRLDLTEGTFIMKPRATDADRHGPVTKIRFENVVIPTLFKDVFKSTLAEVAIVDSRVNSVMSEAFSGNTINSVIVSNSTLDNVHAAAFSERTLLINLEIINSHVRVMHEAALLSATTNLTVDRSRITTIYGGAFNATVARTQFTNNEVGTLHPKAFTIDLWSQINIDNNKFRHVRKDGLDVPKGCEEPCEFTFTGNEVLSLDNGALKFVTLMPPTAIAHFENNNLMKSCHCDIDDWLLEQIGSDCQSFARNNYCVVDPLIAACYDVPEGPIIIRNFTDTHCLSENEHLRCKNFSIDANIVQDLPLEDKNSKLILGLIICLILLIAVSGTIVILLIHGGMWLKRKGYCVRFSNLSNQYRVEEESTEIEEIIIPPEKVPEEHLPEELTQDLLASLREKLEDPQTYEEAREMIERLYDHFITEDSYINNNSRQDEETHLYEELGNLQPNAINGTPPARPFNFLRLIEERFNLINTDLPSVINSKSVLVGEYSEPTDAEVHLYSELPNNKEGKQNEINESLTRPIVAASTSTQRSNRSNSSGGMTSRPLPEKPIPSTSHS